MNNEVSKDGVMSVSLGSAARSMIPPALSAVVVGSLLQSSTFSSSEDSTSLSTLSSHDGRETRERNAVLVFRVLQNICNSGRQKDALLKLLLRAVSGDEEGVLMAEREMRIGTIGEGADAETPVGMSAVIVSFSFLCFLFHCISYSISASIDEGATATTTGRRKMQRWREGLGDNAFSVFS